MPQSMQTRNARLLIPLCLATLLAYLVAACGGGSSASEHTGSIIIATVTPEPSPAITPTPEPNAPQTPDTPTTGRWIDVDLTRYEVQLMEGSTVLRTIGPIAVGAEIDTGNYESTQTGLFHVYIKRAELSYDAPYDTYISDWVGFDPDKDNGFHSFLKDAAGSIVDPGTGRISNGCIRTGDATAIFEFAEIGMPVLVHL